MSTKPWVVHKFGGTSVQDAAHIRNAVTLAEQSLPQHRTAVVVSSMADVTDHLYTLLALARQQDESYKDELSALEQRHQTVARELLAGDEQAHFLKQLAQDIADLEQVLRTVQLLQSYPTTTQDWLLSFGEIWSARLFHGTLQARGHKSSWVDARTFLVVRHGETGPDVQWNLSQHKIDEELSSFEGEALVVTGFIATTEEGEPTTLKRDGSDYSASILGALLKAEELTIWTDVEGVYSADPRRVAEAVLLQHLSWQEATELAYFGARVLHPHAMWPAVQNNIPINLRSSLHPERSGTRIEAPQLDGMDVSSAPPVKGFATIDGMSLMNVEGAGMMGVPGIAQRLFGALREVDVSVVMISQASSEHSICFAIPHPQEAKALQTLEEAFFREIQRKQIQTIEAQSPCAILAVVGDRMVETPGVAAQFFAALGQAGVNVRAIAQGSSERNISVVIDQADSARALRAAHAGFYLSQQTLSIGLVGPGSVGASLLDQLNTQFERLREDFNIDIRVRGIMNSRSMVLHDERIPLDNWRTHFEEESVQADPLAFVTHIRAEHIPHAAILDCTATPLAEQWYLDWLVRRLHIITPNKKAFSGPYPLYQQLKSLSRRNRVHLLYETTVGAALPVLATLQDLLQTGDRILAIEGVFSGTLSYIFNTLSPSVPFSEVVTTAQQQGFTEPDPRDDLSGMDVARKVSILAREMGYPIELKDIPVESLVPEPLQDVQTAEAFLKGLPAFDADMQQRVDRAHQNGQVLRYVGSIDASGKASVKLKAYPKDHAFAQMTGTDNIISFRTQRYDVQPIVVRGPGAGLEETAGGVFADLLRLAARLGAVT